MKAIILCAGYGTRLYPLTRNKPKQLLLIDGKPILNYIIEQIQELEEIDEIFITVPKKFEKKFLFWLDIYGYAFKKKIEIIKVYSKIHGKNLGGIGSLSKILYKKKIKDDVLVIAGDNLFDFSLSKLINFSKKHRKIINVLFKVKNKNEARRFGVVKLEKNKIINFKEKPKKPETNLVSGAIYFFPKINLIEVKNYAKHHGNKEGLGYFLEHLLKINKEVYGFVSSGRFFDIGVIEDYIKADKTWNKKWKLF